MIEDVGEGLPWDNPKADVLGDLRRAAARERLRELREIDWRTEDET